MLFFESWRVDLVRVQKEEKWRFLKDALWGGGGTHRSWPGGRGGRPRALVAGEGWGGRGLPRAVWGSCQGRSKFRNVCRIFVVSNAYKKMKNGVF